MSEAQEILRMARAVLGRFEVAKYIKTRPELQSLRKELHKWDDGFESTEGAVWKVTRKSYGSRRQSLVALAACLWEYLQDTGGHQRGVEPPTRAEIRALVRKYDTDWLDIMQSEDIDR
jgi:hypothetical protein